MVPLVFCLDLKICDAWRLDESSSRSTLPVQSRVSNRLKTETEKTGLLTSKTETENWFFRTEFRFFLLVKKSLKMKAFAEFLIFLGKNC